MYQHKKRYKYSYHIPLFKLNAIKDKGKPNISGNGQIIIMPLSAFCAWPFYVFIIFKLMSHACLWAKQAMTKK